MQSPAPAARILYFAWLSKRTGSAVTPIFSAMMSSFETFV